MNECNSLPRLLWLCFMYASSLSGSVVLLPAKNFSDDDSILFYGVKQISVDSGEILSQTISDAQAKIRKRSNESRNFVEFPLGNRDGWYCKTFTTRIMMRSEVGHICRNVKKEEKERKRITHDESNHAIVLATVATRDLIARKASVMIFAPSYARRLLKEFTTTKT